MSPRNPRTDVLRFLGLAHRAGSVVRGTGAVRVALRSGSVRLVLLAGDASAGQTDKLTGLLHGQGVPHAVAASKVELGDALGAAPCSAVGITAESFAEGLLERLTAAGTPVVRPAQDEEERRTHAG